ncbi:MAG TPA: YCF48-related protein [Dehalococcoidia bacterium]
MRPSQGSEVPVRLSQIADTTGSRIARVRWIVLLAALLLSVACQHSHAASPTPAPPKVETRGARVEGSTVRYRITAAATHGGATWLAVDDRIVEQAASRAAWSEVGRVDASVVALSFVSPTDGWAGTTAGLRRTRDGGRSWNAVAIGDGSVAQVDFTDLLHGWIATGGGWRRTTDGGATWTSVDDPCRASAPYVRFTYTGADDGLAYCVQSDIHQVINAVLFRTSDGGESWADVSSALISPVSARDIPGLPARSYPVGLALVSGKAILVNEAGIFVSDDGGKQWRAMTSASASGEFGTAVIDRAGRVVAVDESGVAAEVIDIDGSRQRLYMLPNDPSLPRSVSSVDPDSRIGASTRTWAEALPGYELFADAVRWPVIWAIGSPCPPAGDCTDVDLVRSADGGHTWIRILVPGVDPQHIDVSPHGLIRIESIGAAYETNDAGETWERVYPPLAAP